MSRNESPALVNNLSKNNKVEDSIGTIELEFKKDIEKITKCAVC